MIARPGGRVPIAIFMAAGLGGSSGRAGAQARDAAAPVAQVRDAKGQAHTDFFPLPLYATAPTEGSTFGALPVFLRVNAAGDTTSITAPSVTWNSATGVNGTFRFYDVASRMRSWSLIAAASTHVNRTLRFEYKDAPTDPGRFTLEIQAVARRSLFYRYFGMGPDTSSADQSSYTRELALLSVRSGLIVVRHFEAGLRGGVHWDRPERHAIFGLPATQDRFPDAPGLAGAALATAELSLRFDTRPEGDYARRGLASELHVARQVGLEHSDSFWQATWHTRELIPETRFLTGAARLYWTDELGGRDVPFYYRSALGGEILFRAFGDDRFIDRGAWEAEVEQRFRLFETHWFHTTAEWRIDPFVAVGQVYPRLDTIVSRPRAAIGVGFRAYVHPYVLGRVDVAYASDGTNVYVTLGYPY